VGVLPLWDEEKSSLWMLPGYFEGVSRAGGIPVMLPLVSETEALRRLCGACDGFLFTGGQDVSPALYGEGGTPLMGPCCPARDEMERLLLDMLLAADKPVLGICRGLQFLNAALGGSLHQDLAAQLPGAVEHRQAPPYCRPSHGVALVPGSPLQALLGGATLAVNSCHHQGVRELAPGLSAMAAAPDGLVEAVYMPGKSFVWAVQWHPEFASADEASGRLFARFIRACEGRPG